MRTAIIIGATGLVGNQLVNSLVADDRFSRVVVFTRRALPTKNIKIEEHIIDFASPAEWIHLVKGDILFSALGTTIKQAGTRQKQYEVDHTYQLEFAKAAASNNVPVYGLISSAGADGKSAIFYSRMKGELEEEVKKLSFQSISILQPGLLVGKRSRQRTGEKIGYTLLSILNALGILKKYKPIDASIVAKAMIGAGLSAIPGVRTSTLLEVFRLAEN